MFDTIKTIIDILEIIGTFNNPFIIKLVRTFVDRKQLTSPITTLSCKERKKEISNQKIQLVQNLNNNNH